MQIKFKHIILASFSAITLTIVVWAVLKHRISIHNSADPIANAIIDFQNPVSIKQINVLTGNEFDLVLQDGRRIHAVLEVKTTPLAKSKVLEFINRCKNPRVLVRQDLGESIWMVELFVTTKGTDGGEVEVSLAKWLQEKNLAYR